MNRKNFIVIIVLLVISLVSILFVQFNWIADLNRLNEDRFKKDIQHVLYMINERLEEKEIINLTKDNLQATFKIKRSTESGDIELIESTFNKKTLDSSDVLNSDNSLQFDIESGDSKDGEVNSNVNASIQIENLQSLNLDSSMQTQINKILDRSEMIQIILNKLLTNDRTITSDINKDFLNTFDIVVSNPPFYKEHKNRSKNELENHAKVIMNIEKWIDNSVKLLKDKGIIFLIITTEILDLVLYHLRNKTGSFKIFPFWPNSKKSSKRIILVARKGGASPTELMSGLKLYNKKKMMTKKARLISEKGTFNFS